MAASLLLCPPNRHLRDVLLGMAWKSDGWKFDQLRKQLRNRFKVIFVSVERVLVLSSAPGIKKIVPPCCGCTAVN